MGCTWARSEERRVGKRVDLGGRRIIKKKKDKKRKKWEQEMQLDRKHRLLLANIDY